MEKGSNLNEQIQKLLEIYYKTDKQRLKKAFYFIESKGENWDSSVKSKDGTVIENLSLLLVYEYALATEKITNGRISFDEALKKLNQIYKFRLGEPKSGDEEIIYCKSIDDESAMSVMSDEYDKVRITTGAQYADYVDENGKLRGAVLIYGKKVLEDGRITAGMNFDDLSDIRQTVFHEWTHNAERETFKIDESEYELPFKYKSIDGKEYYNYEKITQYRLPVFKDGKFIGMSGKVYMMDPADYVMVTTGLTTREINNKGIIMHNQITEGFVEMYARKMVLAIDSNAKIDEGKYYEYVEMAKRVDWAIDNETKKGETAAKFLSHSSILKKELEEKNVDGEKDGLHYIADYADDVRAGKTKKVKSLMKFNEIASKLKLSREEIEEIQQEEFWTKTTFTDEDINSIFNKIKKYVKDSEFEIYDEIFNAIKTYISEVNNEQNFFNNIPDKLGYKGIPDQPLGDSEGEER